jgi:uncharacterized protein YndB with AHSA1/START domain
VFDAFLDPDLIRSWFGPGLGEIVHIDVHAHVGGVFSISQRRGEMVIDTHGTYHTLDRPRRLAFSWATPAVRLPEAQEGERCPEANRRSGKHPEVALTSERQEGYRSRDWNWSLRNDLGEPART